MLECTELSFSKDKNRPDSEDVEKTKAANPQGVYIPPHARNRPPPLAESSTKQFISKGMDEIITSVEKLNIQQPDFILDEFDIEANNFQTELCCIILTGFSNDVSETFRQNILNSYHDKGAQSHWITNKKCLIVFASEHNIKRILSSPPPVLYRRISLKDYNDTDKEDLLQIGSEIRRQMKPIRDVSTASRMIGAALGVRVAKTSIPQKKLMEHGSASSQKKDDAWDD
eukprot:gene10854-22655_t